MRSVRKHLANGVDASGPENHFRRHGEMEEMPLRDARSALISNEGDVTFLKISLGGNQGAAGVAQWHFFHLAVAPEMILGASRIDTVREVLANRAHSSSPTGLASVPRFQAGRAQFPENLDGLSYFDFQKVDWQAAKDHWIEDARKNSTTKSAAPSKETAPSRVPDWLAQVNPQVFSRHLHYSSSVSWKDSKGIHWDQWVE